MKTEAGNRNSYRRRQQQSEAGQLRRLRLAGGTMEGSKQHSPAATALKHSAEWGVAGSGPHLYRTVLTPKNQSSAAPEGR